MINIPPKTLIIGPGALGLGLGGLLSEYCDVSLVGKADGQPKNQYLFGDGGTLERRVTLKWTPNITPQKFDHIWITTPAQSVKDVCQLLKGAGEFPKLILIACNGLGIYEEATKILGKKAPVCRALVEVGFNIQESGAKVIITGQPKVILAAPSNIQERVQDLSAYLGSNGWISTTSSNPQQAEWLKVIFNVFVNPVCAILGCVNGEVLGTALPVALSAANEAKEVAKAAGIDVAEITDETLIQKINFSRSNICSTLAQIQKGKQTELDYITGAVMRAGKKFGIKTPVIEALHSMVLAKEKLTL